MKKSICIISLSNIAFDSRVLRQVAYLSRKYHLTVIGYGSLPSQYTGIPNITWKEIPQPKNGLLRMISHLFSRLILLPFLPKKHIAFQLVLDTECDAYHANNWDALPIAALAARQNHGILILDIHESYDSWYWGLSSWIVKFIYNKYSNEIDATSTVVDMLVVQHKQFGFEPIVIRNIPFLPANSVDFRPTNTDCIKLIHHGIASPIRSTDLMIRTLAQCDPRYQLHLALVNFDSKYVSTLRVLADQIAPGRVFFHRPYSPSEIVQEISNYDIGFFPLPPKSHNYLIALPNKLFEFIAAGLAVLIGPSPSMAKIINQYECGLVAPTFEPDLLAKILNNIATNEIDQMKRASLKASQVLNAEVEMKQLDNLFKSLF